MSQFVSIIGDVTPHQITVDVTTKVENMFRPSVVEKVIYQGDTPTFNFQINDAGVAKSLTGLTLSFAAKSAASPSSPFLFNVTPERTDTIGQASVALTSSQTAETGDYTAEVIVWSATTRVTAVQFPLTIVPSVSI